MLGPNKNLWIEVSKLSGKAGQVSQPVQAKRARAGGPVQDIR